MPATHKRPTKKTDMAYLDTEVMPADLKVEDIGKYLNIPDTTLDKNVNLEFETVFGPVINIQRAIDYAVHNKLLPDQLMMKNIPKSSYRKLSKDHQFIPNFWAYIGYLVIERINQDSELLDLVLKGAPVINVTSKKSKILGKEVTVVTPNVNEKMYTGVVRAVIEDYRGTTSEERSKALNDLLQNLKKDRTQSVFSGMPFTAEFL
jgi:hypothetical protein